MGGADQLLQRRLLARDGRERHRVARQGLACRRHRPPRAAQLGDRERREAQRGRGRRRRGRAEPALGDCPDHAQRAPRWWRLRWWRWRRRKWRRRRWPRWRWHGRRRGGGGARPPPTRPWRGGLLVARE